MDWKQIGIKDEIKEGKNYVKCPQCSHKRHGENKNKPCLTINEELNNHWYKCHNCGWSGNLDTQEKYRKVQEKSAIPQSIPEVYHKSVQTFLFDKGISVLTARKEQIYHREIGGIDYVCFPVMYHNQIVNYKCRNLGYLKNDKPKFFQASKDDGALYCFYGMDSIDYDIKELIICEGETDFLTWKECGYNNVISVPMGAFNPNSKNINLDYLRDPYFLSIVSKMDWFLLATDGDVAGKSLRDYFSKILGKDKCKILAYPEGYKDINEVFNGDSTKGLDSLKQDGVKVLYEARKPIPIQGIVQVNDFAEEMAIIREKGFERGYHSSTPLDALFSAKSPYLYVMTGVWGSGKSTVLRWYIANLAKNNNLKIAVFSPESRPPYRELIKYMEAYSCKVYKKGLDISMTDEETIYYQEEVNKHIKIINPSFSDYEDFGGRINQSNAKGFESLFGYLKYLNTTEGISGYIIDPWNTIEHNKKNNETDHDYVRRVLENIHAFNSKYELFSFIVAHPTKEVKKLKSGNFERPSLSTISGGSNWGNKTDVGIIISRNPWELTEGEIKYNNDVPVEIYTEKIKFEELGNIGLCTKLQMLPNGSSFIGTNEKTFQQQVNEIFTPEPSDVPF